MDEGWKEIRMKYNKDERKERKERKKERMREQHRDGTNEQKNTNERVKWKIIMQYSINVSKLG